MQQFVLALTALIAIVAIYVLYLKVSRVEKNYGELVASFNLYVEERAEDEYVTRGELHGDVLPAVVDYVNELVEEEAQRTETCLLGRGGNDGAPRDAAEPDDEDIDFFESDGDGRGGDDGEEGSSNLPRVAAGPKSNAQRRAKAEDGEAEKKRGSVNNPLSTGGPLASAVGGTEAEAKLRRWRNGQRLLQSLEFV